MLILVLIGALAFYLAWNLGANDVANSMGTAVGAKAISLKQALLIAGILELAGALLFGQSVAATLATKIVSPALFEQNPAELTIGMIAVTLACGIWLNVATNFGLPVSSSHAIVGALAGFGVVAAGFGAVAWRSIGIISLSWVVTPIVSAIVAAILYSVLKQYIFRATHPVAQFNEWIPWLSTIVFAAFGWLILPTVSELIQIYLTNRLSWTVPNHSIALLLGSIATFSFSWFSWQRLAVQATEQAQTTQDSPGKDTIEENTIEADTALVEQQLSRFQVLSACFVAFAHGSNDVGNAIAPLAAIVQIVTTGTLPSDNFQVPFWVLLLGGGGIVAGLAVWGEKVIATIGQGIIALQPSGGFCAQLGAAMTVLLASRLGLPVSTSHAIVGGVVGIGLVQNWRSIQLKVLREIAAVWVVTIPAAAGLAIVLFVGLRSLSGWVW